MKLAKHLLIVSALVLGLATSAFAVDCPSPIARIGSFDFLVDYSGSMLKSADPHQPADPGPVL